jgi:hypothetical protein
VIRHEGRFLGSIEGLERSPNTTLRIRIVIPASDEQADVCIIMSVKLDITHLCQSAGELRRIFPNIQKIRSRVAPVGTVPVEKVRPPKILSTYR